LPNAGRARLDERASRNIETLLSLWLSSDLGEKEWITASLVGVHRGSGPARTTMETARRKVAGNLDAIFENNRE
jgi:hypothetical protein